MQGSKFNPNPDHKVGDLFTFFGCMGYFLKIKMNGNSIHGMCTPKLPHWKCKDQIDQILLTQEAYSLICVRNYSKIVSIISYPTAAVFNKSTFLLSPFMIFSLTFLLAGSLSVTGWKATDATEQQLTTHNLRCNMGIVCGMERDFSWSYEGFGHLM